MMTENTEKEKLMRAIKAPAARDISDIEENRSFLGTGRSYGEDVATSDRWVRPV